MSAGYRQTFAYYWKQRTRSGLLLTADEAEFSPPALALEKRPVSPTLRLTAAVLVMLVALVLLWAILARVDIVVEATGKVVPSGWSKTIASVDTASVRAIHVTEGQAVKAGDILIELDTRAHEADRDKATAEELVDRLQMARSQALIAALDSGRPPRLAAVAGVSVDSLHAAQLYLNGQYLEYSARLEQLNSQIHHSTAAVSLALEREKIHESLLASNDVSKDAWLAKKQDRMNMQARLAEAINQRSELIALTREQAYESMATAGKSAASAAQEAIKARSHIGWLTLRAPLDGTVQQVAVHTVGGVVQAAQPLLLVVPAGKHVEVDAMLQNKDVGFVRTGQKVELKVRAFDFTKYGTITGTVLNVSHDAIENKDQGLVYSVKVKLDKPAIRVQGREVPLTPGMSVDVDIKTGTRRVIEYVLSPLLRGRRESLHER